MAPNGNAYEPVPIEQHDEAVKNARQEGRIAALCDLVEATAEDLGATPLDVVATITGEIGWRAAVRATKEGRRSGE